MKSVFTDKNNLNVLIYNSDLPIFPGAGAHEFLNTTQLAKWVHQVGLISMIHNAKDSETAKIYADYPVKLYLWESPQIQNKTQGAPIQKKGLLFFIKKRLKFSYNCLMQWIGIQIKHCSKKPADIFYADRLFRHMSAPLTKALTEQHWHALVVIQSRCAGVIDYIPTALRSILIMHDIRSLVYHRQIATVQSWWKKKYCQLQAKRYFHFEKKQCQQYDLIVSLSDADAAWITQYYSPKKIAIVPIPVDLHYFKPLENIKEIPNRIVFTGHMSHPPNVDAAVFFAKMVLPLIQKHLPDTQFYIVGKDPTMEVLKLAQLPNVTVTGTVTDTRIFLAEAAIIVVPLRFGSGVRNKILEAWGMQKCIVSTSLGAEGLTYTPDQHLKIADDAPTMAQAILSLLSDPEQRLQLSLQGREMAALHHDPERIGHHYFQEINNLISQNTNPSSPMRISIDIRWMVPGLAGGIENVARSFINELMDADRHNEYKLMLNPQCQFDINQAAHPNIRCVRETNVDLIKKRLNLLRSGLYSKLRIEHLYSPSILNLRFLRELNVDMVYSFPGYIRPELYPLPNILMVPDIQHEFLPEFFHEKVLEERRRVYGNSIKTAVHLCAISEFTRQTLIDKLHIKPDNITTILLAADPIFSHISHASDETVLNQYHLTANNYLFFPAHTWHHKNHLAAIKALQILRDKYALKPYLICTGGKREAQPYIEKFIAETGLQKQVRFLGYCSRDSIPALYRGALALIYPSLFEGFGMPVLEAMKSGCPVICSNTTSLPEIAGPAALLVDPSDHETMADAMFNIIKNHDLRQQLIQNGLKQAALFSWQKHTMATLAVFKKIHQRIRPGIEAQ